jgi:uncharacterized repeat protein (TIGR03843 family)
MPELTILAIMQILEKGEATLKGEFVWGSNYTFLVEIQNEDQKIPAVYKPTQGERPLWDFPAASLARREAAAFVVSDALEWDLVPPTVYREAAPLGPGSLQVFIEHDPEYHYFNFSDEDKQRLRPAALFDLLVNNADRKGSHVLLDKDDHVWLIDHGICFHVDDKLRTVIWDFAGETFPGELVKDLQDLQKRLKNGGRLRDRLLALLAEEEVQALAERARQLAARPRFPNPDPHHRPYPWPPV